MATTGRNSQNMSEETEAGAGRARSQNVGTTDRVISAVLGGGMMAFGLWRVTRNPWRLAVALAGSPLLDRALRGRSALYRALGLSSNKKAEADKRGCASERGQVVQSTVTINADASHIYNFWHQFENLPRFMLHLESVSRLEGGGWHWVAKAPVGTVEWDAEVTQDISDRLIAWRSRPGSQIPNEGTVEFTAAPGGRGTEVRVRLVYEPPAGKLGVLVAKLFGEEPQQQVDEDLRRLKSLMETGEIPTISGQPSGRKKESRDEARTGTRESHVGTDAAPAEPLRATQDGSVVAPPGVGTARASQDGSVTAPVGTSEQVVQSMFSGTPSQSSATGQGPAAGDATRSSAAIPTSDPETERMRKETAANRKSELKEREDLESDQSFPASDPPARY